MREITHELGTKNLNGSLTKVIRKYFVHDKAKDYFKESHSQFSKEERKAAKYNYKNNR